VAQAPLVAAIGQGAIGAGIDGLWLAAGLGVILLAAGLLGTPLFVSFFPSTVVVAEGATAYLMVSWSVCQACFSSSLPPGFCEASRTRKPPW